MTPKQMIWLGATVGSIIGGLIPLVWGADSFSVSGIVFSALGGFAGIWAGFRLSR